MHVPLCPPHQLSCLPPSPARLWGQISTSDRYKSEDLKIQVVPVGSPHPAPHSALCSTYM